MTDESKQRLAYVDWMRGLACLLMFQTHCYDSWLSPAARQSKLFMWSQLVGTLPAPLFLFLAGVSFALVTNNLREKGMAPGEIARTTIRRGAEILGLALLFRVQEFLLGQPWPGALFGQIGAPHGAPWTDLLRVDILNMMGLSMMLMGVVCRVAATRARSIAAACGVALGVAMLTPPVWTTWRVVTHRLPWPLESYLNGVHTFAEPQPWLFPIFPWTGLAFAGLAAGFALFSKKEEVHAKAPSAQRRAEASQTQSATEAQRTQSQRQTAERELRVLLWLGAVGVVLIALSWWLDALPVQLYAVYDYWHTGPNFFLIRVGILLVILLGCYVWCRWGAGTWGFSPMIQLGQSSLVVYWVHIEFVYGRFSILPKRGMGVLGASLGLLGVFVAMVLLSLANARWKARRKALASGAKAPGSHAG